MGVPPSLSPGGLGKLGKLSENEFYFADPVPQPLLSTWLNWRVENKSFTHFSRGETGHLSRCLQSDAPWTGSGMEMPGLPVQYRPGQTVTNWHVLTVEDQTHLSSLLFPETTSTFQRFGHKLWSDGFSRCVNIQTAAFARKVSCNSILQVVIWWLYHSLCKSPDQTCADHYRDEAHTFCSTPLHCTGSQIQMTFTLSEKI